MRFTAPSITDHPLHPEVNTAYRGDEAEQVRLLRKRVGLDADQRTRIAARARTLVEKVRRQRTHKSGADAFMHEYALSSQEGVALMCLAEALLRIPDAETADELIRDKITAADWSSHREQSDSLFVNASTWALMLTGRLLEWHDGPASDLRGALHRLLERSGEPFIRAAAMQAMRVLGHQFVMGRTIGEGLERARSGDEAAYRHSYDMLGEAARTEADAERYFGRYLTAIRAVGEEADGAGPIAGPGISVKLSALHPRFEPARAGRMHEELLPRLRQLALEARAMDIGLTVDAEEAERLDITLDMIAALLADPELEGWQGLGLALQAYQKRAFYALDLLANLARRHGRRLMLRLVKGAYWDTEIKSAQVRGLEDYPVFTRKVNTDVSYLACARKLLGHSDVLFPQFATHNAHTVAAILEMAGSYRDFEFQRLHGMGEALYDQIVGPERLDLPCRAYDPVGSHEDLLPYLVRRLLENGANTSFVNRILDERTPVETIVADPVERSERLGTGPHPRIPLPRDLYRPDRRNSRGVDLSDFHVLGEVSQAMETTLAPSWTARPVVGGVLRGGEVREVYDPSDHRRALGRVVEARREDLDVALETASGAAEGWDRTPAEERARCLERTADLLEAHMGDLVALCAREGGKLISDGVAEVREAADFCRYYAARAREAFDSPRELPGPTGEYNGLSLHGRGVFACISPWNFPLAIFTGQVAAALAAGNAVIAKPAEQTPLVAAQAVGLMHQAGMPPEVLHLLPGSGGDLGKPLVEDRRIAGVAFTGSVETAQAINQSLAARGGPIVPLIAETGGQNAMIVDSSALPEQLVEDILISAFQSAGQRCSALRVLYIQEDVADHVLEMLAGAMAELVIGDPWDLATDVGPVIDDQARERLEAHAQRMEREARLIYRCRLPEGTEPGIFFAPRAYEIDDIAQLEGEVFGPILHVIRYPADGLDRVIEAINATGFGLTFGLHSRIDRAQRYVTSRVKAGNAYVNRHMIGSVVGVQPFGGEGLSGTGPKAGGPHYLQRFSVERALTVNTAAAGGNATLMSLQDEEL